MIFVNNANVNRARSFSGNKARSCEQLEEPQAPKKTSKNSLMIAGAVVLGCTAMIAVWAFKHFGAGSGISLQAQTSIAADSMPTTYQYGGSNQPQLASQSSSYYAPAQSYSSLPRASFHAQGSTQSYGGRNLVPATFHSAGHLHRHRTH